MSRFLHSVMLLFIMGMCAQTALADDAVVTDPSDDGVTTTNVGTLRWAVAQVNSGTKSGIVFSGSLSNSITVLSALTITANGVWVVGNGNVIGGTGSGSGNNDLFHFNGTGCALRDLVLIHANNAVIINGSASVASCLIGTDANSTWNLGNHYGIVVNGSATIGGNTAALRNVISGNVMDGILVNAGATAAIQNNYIGTNVAGTADIFNGGNGIYVNQGVCLIGGDSSNNEGNLISGNHNSGIACTSQGTTICGNVIGLNAAQTVGVPNAMRGIYLVSAGGYACVGNFIGLPAAHKYNVIAGNCTSGTYGQIALDAAGANVIKNNYIGVNFTGVSFGGPRGIYFINGCQGNLVGGNRSDTAWDRNVISGSGIGVALDHSGGNTISGNYIGTDLNGTAAALYNTIGIFVNYSDHNLIGGLNASANSLYGNVISGNTSYGLQVSSSSGNTVQGNYLGLGADGTTQINNGSDAIIVNNTFGNLFGGLADSQKNIIVGNAASSGIHFQATSFSEGNTVVGNWIGVTANTAVPAVKLNSGIYLDGSAAPADNNFVGLPNSGHGNLIANVKYGILLDSNSGQNWNYNNGLFGNTVCATTSFDIRLLDGSNAAKAIPTISAAIGGVVSGQSEPNNYIEVYISNHNSSYYNGGSLTYLGAAQANGSGAWSMSVAGVSNGAYVTALATDGYNNTSQFAQNHLYGPLPTATFTVTATPTITATPTVTVTSTITTTPTAGPSVTQTPTVIPTFSPTATSSLAGWNNSQAYGLIFPNPAREHAVFLLQPEQPARIQIEIYNAAAERIAVLGQSFPAGKGQSLTWDCKHAAPGIYLARILADGNEMKKVRFAVVH